MSDHELDEPVVPTPQAADPEVVQADQDDLTDALGGLSQVALGAQPLEESLARIGALAVLAIPGADGAGVTMLEAGHGKTVAASDPFVRAVDDIQYGLGEGPCVTAVAEHRTIVSGVLGEDRSWPRFGPRVRSLGVNSALSLPLVLADDTLGALNVYARDRDVFTDQAARLGETFAVAAAVAVHNVRILMQAQRLAGQLQAALTNRATIDQAIGIICARQGFTATEAFARLRTISQGENVKLHVVAQNIVNEAIRRARARHAES